METSVLETKEASQAAQNGDARYTVKERARSFYEILARRPLIDVPKQNCSSCGSKEDNFWNKQSDITNEITLYSWRPEWVKNTADNIKYFGHFNREHSVKIFAEELRDKPCIIVGAGPSLQKNIVDLRLAKEAGVKIIATSHAYMYLSHPEVQVKPDYVVVLDAGGQWTEYLDTQMDSSDIPLLAEQTCNSAHLRLWKGPVLFYKSLYSASGIGKLMQQDMDSIVPYEKCGAKIHVGGHVTAASTVLAMTLMRSNYVVFVGTDYCFTPENEGGQFYPFQGTPMEYLIDKPSTPEKHGMCWNILGQEVYSNQSYLHFKNIMDDICMKVCIEANKSYVTGSPAPVTFVNATEGGMLGAFDKGNSKYMRYTMLEDEIKALKVKIDMDEQKKKEEK